MTKKAFFLFTAVIFSACRLMLCSCASADGAEISYTVSDGCAVVSTVSTSGLSEVVIPRSVILDGKTYTVTEIGSKAFYGNTDIVSVSVPDTVTKIGDRAFAGCQNLTAVNIPDGVTRLEQYTFSDCYRLTSITLPKSLTDISCGAFKRCIRLEYLVIGSDEFSIIDEGSESFSALIADYNSGDDIPEVREGIAPAIGSSVYGGTKFFVKNAVVANVLKNCSVPEYAIYTGEQYGVNSSLASDGLSFDGVVTPNGNYALIKGFEKGCEPNTDITLNIPEQVSAGGIAYTVTEISDGAFYSTDLPKYSNHITGITLPDTLQKIGENAFHNCSVKKLVIPSGVRVVSEAAFKSCVELTELEIKDGVKALGFQSFYNSSIRYLVLPESVRYFNLSAVQANSYLTKTVIGSSEAEFAGIVSGLPSGYKIFVKNESVKSALEQKGAESGSAEVLSGNIAVLRTGYNYNIPEVLSVGETLQLPKLERALFTHTGWSDGVNTYGASDEIGIADSLTVLTALWQFNPEDTTRITADIVKENAINRDYTNYIMKKDESSYVDSAETLNVRIDESRITRNIDMSFFGVTTSSETSVDMLVNDADGSLSEYAEAIVPQLPKFQNIRGWVEPFVGLFDDYSIYTGSGTRELSLLKLKRAMSALVGIYLEINPDCEFIFILPVYAEDKTKSMSAQACLNMHRFLTDDASASEWGALRESIGYGRVKVKAYELGNETYYNCRYLEENAQNLEIIEKESEAYIKEAMEYYNAVFPYAPGIEFSASLVSADCGFWQDEWNSRVIKGLNSCTNGLYSLHTYYGKYNSPQTMTSSNTAHIAELYHEQIGYIPEIRFAHTEHAIWGSAENRISLTAGLAEMTFMNSALIRDNIFCTDYHTFASGSEALWGILNDFGGGFTETAVSKAYKLYLQNIGDRVVEVTYDSFISKNGSYAISETNTAPNTEISVLATASGEDTLVLNIVSSYIEKCNNSVTLNFDFLNEYSLVSEQVYGGYNPYSSILNPETADVVWIKDVSDNLTESFTSYTIAPNSAAVLILKTKSKIGSELCEKEPLRKPQDGIYADMMEFAEQNQNGEYELPVPRKIDYISYSGSDESFELKALNLFGRWETLAKYDTVGDMPAFNPYTDSYFSKIKLVGAQKSEVEIYCILSTEYVDYVGSGGGQLRLISVENGAINNSPSVTCTDGSITYADGGYKINSTDEIFFTADVSSASAGYKIRASNTDGIYTLKTDFNGMETLMSSGADLAIADGSWKSAAHNGAFSFGIDGCDASDMYSAFMDGEYMTLSSRALSENPAEFAAVYHKGEINSVRGCISFDIIRCAADIEYGLRFLVHNGERDFYQLGIQKYSSLSTNLQWVLSKVTDGVKEELVSGVYSINPVGGANRITLVYDENGIYWTGVNITTGATIAALCGSYKPFGKIETFNSTFGFYAYSYASDLGSDKCVYIDNVEAVFFGVGTETFDYIVSDGAITINGLNFAGSFAGAELTIPSEINGVPVKKIADSAFENAEFSELIISEGIEEIGARAFFGSKLVRASIPGTVTSWGGASFQDCACLREVCLGSGIKKIPDAFYNCSSLNYFIIPASVEEVDCAALALSRLRLVIFEGDSVKLLNTAALTSTTQLGDRLLGDISLCYISDAMGSTLREYFPEDILIRTQSDGTQQRAVVKEAACSGITAYFQRGNPNTGGIYHYKTLFAYAKEATEGVLLLVSYNSDGSIADIFKQPVKLQKGEYKTIDVSQLSINAGEKTGMIMLMFIDNLQNITPLSEAFKSTPW